MANLLVFNLKTDADDDVLGFTTAWVNALAARFERVFVITMHAGRIAVAGNVTVLSVGREKGWPEWLRLLAFYRLLGGLLLRNRFAGCFAHMMPLFTVLGAPLLKLAGVRTVLWYAHKKCTPMLRAAYALCDVAVTSSREGFPLPGDKVVPIGQGIDTRRFIPSRTPRTGPFRILTVGRISPVKKLEACIKGLAAFRDENPGADFELEIVGSPLGAGAEEYHAELVGLARRLGLEERVVFAGSRAFFEVDRCYREADCFINMCDSGSIDKAILEGMASGLPVATSNKSMLKVLDEDLVTDWFLAPDDAEGLGKRLTRLYRMQAAEREALGARLRALVADGHSLDGLAARIAAQFHAEPDLAGRRDRKTAVAFET